MGSSIISPPAAAAVVSSSHGQLRCRTHFRISRCPPAAAADHQGLPLFGSTKALFVG
jgi:hypothetical protein